MSGPSPEHLNGLWPLTPFTMTRVRPQDCADESEVN